MRLSSRRVERWLRMAGATHKIAGSTNGVRRPGWHSESMSCIRHTWQPDAIVALLLRPRGGVSWAAGIGPPPQPCLSGHPWRRDTCTALTDNTFLLRRWRHGSEGQLLRVVQTETCPGLLRNSVWRREGKLPQVGIVVLLLWDASALLARALHLSRSSFNFLRSLTVDCYRNEQFQS